MTDLCNPSFFHGVCEWEESENGVSITRLPKKVLDWYQHQNENWYKYACCYSGIRLETETNATSLTFSLEYENGTPAFASFGLMIDGQVQPVISLTAEDLCNPVTIPLDGQTHRVVVYFPHLISFVIKSAVAEGDAKPIEPKKQRYYAFGDSITQGSEGENPCFSYPAQLARCFDMEFWNFGVCGLRFREGTLDGIEALPAPDFVTVALGTNDFTDGRTENMSSFLKNCAGYLKKIDAMYHNVPTYIFLPIWRTDEMQSAKRGTLQNIRDNITRIAAFYPNMTVIDCQDMIPHDEKFYDDGLHPNSEGFLHYGKNLCEALKERL